MIARIALIMCVFDRVENIERMSCRSVKKRFTDSVNPLSGLSKGWEKNQVKGL
jgi:hypothetical protein